MKRLFALSMITVLLVTDSALAPPPRRIPVHIRKHELPENLDRTTRHQKEVDRAGETLAKYRREIDRLRQGDNREGLARYVENAMRDPDFLRMLTVQDPELDNQRIDVLNAFSQFSNEPAAAISEGELARIYAHDGPMQDLPMAAKYFGELAWDDVRARDPKRYVAFSFDAGLTFSQTDSIEVAMPYFRQALKQQPRFLSCAQTAYELALRNSRPDLVAGLCATLIDQGNARLADSFLARTVTDPEWEGPIADPILVQIVRLYEPGYGFKVRRDGEVDDALATLVARSRDNPRALELWRAVQPPKARELRQFLQVERSNSFPAWTRAARADAAAYSGMLKAIGDEFRDSPQPRGPDEFEHDVATAEIAALIRYLDACVVLPENTEALLYAVGLLDEIWSGIGRVPETNVTGEQLLAWLDAHMSKIDTREMDKRSIRRLVQSRMIVADLHAKAGRWGPPRSTAAALHHLLKAAELAEEIPDLRSAANGLWKRLAEAFVHTGEPDTALHLYLRSARGFTSPGRFDEARLALNHARSLIDEPRSNEEINALEREIRER